MKLVAIALAVPLVVACTSKPTDQPAPVAKTAPAAAPFTGPLTVNIVMSAQDVVKPLQPWGDAFAALQAKLGPPTKVDGKKYEWAAMNGDDCAYFVVEQDDGARYKMSGPVVGAIQHPGTFGKTGAIGNRGDCLDILGKGAPPEDPNAPGPADTNTVADVLDHAVAARSKWDGKRVKITGKIVQSGSTIVLADEKSKDKTMMGNMGSGAADPAPGKTLMLTCTVSVQKVMTGAGDSRLEPSLDDCAGS